MNSTAKALRWWVANAVSWIAFGDAEPPLPEDQCSRLWPFGPSDELLSALRARAERRPWRPERAPALPTWRYRALARRLAREPEADAATLADQLAADLARLESHRTAWENARAELTVAVAGGRIQACGVRCDARGEPVGGGIGEPVPPAVFYNGDRTISPDGMVEPPPDANGNTTLDDIFRPRGPYYRDVTFDAAAVRGMWPKSGSTKKIDAVFEWMLAEARAEEQRIGGKPKRDQLIKACVEAMRCRFEDAEAAYANLPEQYRRKRGEHGRAAAPR